jgi:hypothetical protein
MHQPRVVCFEDPEEHLNPMTDTVRIERPLFSRRHNDSGGRVKHDCQGNAVVVKTRHSDTQEAPDISPVANSMEPTIAHAGQVPHKRP